MEIDPDPSPVAVVVAGQNELHHSMPTSEFLWILTKTNERLSEIAKDKKILLLPPPLQNSLLPEPKIREEFFHENLKQLNEANPNIHVMENPLQGYNEDGGEHPSPEDTEKIIRYLHEQTQILFDIPYLLPSSTAESLTTDNKYSKVNSLYKYGCGGCNSKKKNRMYNLCNQCKEMQAPSR